MCATPPKPKLSAHTTTTSGEPYNLYAEGLGDRTKLLLKENLLKIFDLFIWAVIVHAFSPTTEEEQAGGSLSLFEASLVFKVISRTARTVTEKPCLEKTCV